MDSFVRAQQPSLRPFIVFDHLPEGMAAYPVTDGETEPLLSIGEVVVVDPTDTSPSIGELFLIQWMRDPVARIVETWPVPKMEDYWCVGAVRQPEWMASKAGRWCDWPYRTGHLQTKLLGRVVGILETRSVEPRRLAAPRHQGEA